MYPHTPGYRENETSRDAAEQFGSEAGNLRVAVLALLKAHPLGLSTHQIADRLKRSVPAVQPRVSELRAIDLIRKSGRRHTNASGMTAHIWVL